MLAPPGMGPLAALLASIADAVLVVIPATVDGGDAVLALRWLARSARARGESRLRPLLPIFSGDSNLLRALRLGQATLDALPRDEFLVDTWTRWPADDSKDGKQKAASKLWRAITTFGD